MSSKNVGLKDKSGNSLIVNEAVTSSKTKKLIVTLPWPLTSSASDTTAFWKDQNTFYYKNGTASLLPNFESNWGMLLNFTYGDDVHQLGFGHNRSLYHRAGNASGWYGISDDAVAARSCWSKILDQDNYQSIVGNIALLANNTTLITGNTSFTGNNYLSGATFFTGAVRIQAGNYFDTAVYITNSVTGPLLKHSRPGVDTAYIIINSHNNGNISINAEKNGEESSGIYLGYRNTDIIDLLQGKYGFNKYRFSVETDNTYDIGATGTTDKRFKTIYSYLMDAKTGYVLRTDTSWSNSWRNIPFTLSSSERYLGLYKKWTSNSDRGLQYNPSSGVLRADKVDAQTYHKITFSDTSGADAGSTWENIADLTVGYNTVGAAAASHTHNNYFSKTGGTLTGNLVFSAKEVPETEPKYPLDSSFILFSGGSDGAKLFLRQHDTSKSSFMFYLRDDGDEDFRWISTAPYNKTEENLLMTLRQYKEDPSDNSSNRKGELQVGKVIVEDGSLILGTYDSKLLSITANLSNVSIEFSTGIETTKIATGVITTNSIFIGTTSLCISTADGNWGITFSSSIFTPYIEASNYNISLDIAECDSVDEGEPSDTTITLKSSTNTITSKAIKWVRNAKFANFAGASYSATKLLNTILVDNASDLDDIQNTLSMASLDYTHDIFAVRYTALGNTMSYTGDNLANPYTVINIPTNLHSSDNSLYQIFFPDFTWSDRADISYRYINGGVWDGLVTFLTSENYGNYCVPKSSTLGIATSTNASSIKLEHNTKYKLSAAGKSVVFETPSPTTHPISLVTSSGTSNVSLQLNLKYQLTAGGLSIIFTSPSQIPTSVTYENALRPFMGYNRNDVHSSFAHSGNGNGTNVLDLNTITLNGIFEVVSSRLAYDSSTLNFFKYKGGPDEFSYTSGSLRPLGLTDSLWLDLLDHGYSNRCYVFLNFKNNEHVFLQFACDRDSLYYRGAQGGSFGRGADPSTTVPWKKIALAGHTHSYLPLSGGQLSGSITYKSDLADNIGAASARAATIWSRYIECNELRLNGKRPETGGPNSDGPVTIRIMGTGLGDVVMNNANFRLLVVPDQVGDIKTIKLEDLNGPLSATSTKYWNNSVSSEKVQKLGSISLRKHRGAFVMFDYIMTLNSRPYVARYIISSTDSGGTEFSLKCLWKQKDMKCDLKMLYSVSNQDSNIYNFTLYTSLILPWGTSHIRIVASNLTLNDFTFEGSPGTDGGQLTLIGLNIKTEVQDDIKFGEVTANSLNLLSAGSSSTNEGILTIPGTSSIKFGTYSSISSSNGILSLPNINTIGSIAGIGPISNIDTITTIKSISKITNDLGGFGSNRARIIFSNRFSTSASGSTGSGMNIYENRISIGPSEALSNLAVWTGSSSFIFKQYIAFEAGSGVTSDVRYKKNRNDLPSLEKFIENLPVFEYDWEKEGTTSYHSVGISAQDLEEHDTLKHLVHTSEDGTKSVEYDRLSTVALQVCKELIKEKNELKERLERLEKLVLEKLS